MPNSVLPATAIDADTPARLRMVVGKMSKRLNALSRGSGMTPTQLTVLGSIVREGPMRLGDLAEAEAMNPTMLSRVVAALDEQGLVRRRPDPDDRRAGRLEATAAGRRTHERLRHERGKVIAAGLESLSPQDVEVLERALPALEALAEEVAASGKARR